MFLCLSYSESLVVYICDNQSLVSLEIYMF